MTIDLSIENNISRTFRQTLSYQVYRDLRDLVLSGRITPGEKLTLRRLADAVGTSPMPVRDAVGRLVAERALVMLPNRTVQVPRPTRTQFREIVTIRCSLEGLAAETAAITRSDEDVDAIRRHVVAFDLNASASPPNPLAAIEHNRLLHFTVYRAAGMPTLVKLILSLWMQVGPVFYAVMSSEIAKQSDSVRSSRQRKAPTDSGLLQTTHEWHAALVTAMADRDPAGARSAIVEDIRRAANFIEQSDHLQDDGASSAWSSS